MVKAFDVSVGALITLCVVVSSFVLGPDESWPSLMLGMLFVIAIALGVGAVNVMLIRWLKLSSIIATLATYSVLQGVCLWLRPIPEGTISFELIDMLLYSVGFMPVALIVVAVIAVARRRLAVPLAGRAGGARDGTRRGSRRPARRPRRLPVRPGLLHHRLRRRARRLVPRRPGPDRRPQRRLQLHADEHRRRRARRGEPARRPRIVRRRRGRCAVPERDHQHPAVPRLERVVRPDHGRLADARRAVLLPGARAVRRAKTAIANFRLSRGGRACSPTRRDGRRSSGWSRSRRSAI